jgi:hypothetical protein
MNHVALIALKKKQKIGFFWESVAAEIKAKIQIS